MLRLVVESDSPRSWQELLGRLSSTVVVTARAHDLIAYRADEYATGVRLERAAREHIVALPAFALLGELSLARGLVEQIAHLTNGRIRLENNDIIERTRFTETFDDRLAPDLAKRSLDILEQQGSGTATEPFVVDGVRRPYFIGPTTARRFVALAPDGNVYERATSIIASVQRIDAPTVLAAPRQVRTPDGATSIHAMWNPLEETLLPPCDYLLLRDSATGKIRIPHDRIAEAITLPGDGSSSGALLDERQWLLLAQNEATAARLVAHASPIGRRLRIPDL